MSTNVYTYKKCSTCRKATAWLDAQGIRYTELAIRETPPSKKELKQMLAAYDGNIKRLFNTSGMDYRALGIKDKLESMSDAQAIDLLHSNGNLVKRPFLLAENAALVGFKEAEWGALA